MYLGSRKKKKTKLDGKIKEKCYVPKWTDVLRIMSETPSKTQVASGSTRRTYMVFGDICIIMKSQ